MPRYFIEVSYKGAHYSGFQIQQNANSIQAEVEKALKIFFKQIFQLTGASRTDAGVHALQNYFHCDLEQSLDTTNDFLYSLNAILPADIVIKRIFKVSADAHCRFDAVEREYKYYIYQKKDPFLEDRAFYFPYKLDIRKLEEAAEAIKRYKDFAAFSKRNTQVKHFECSIIKSVWNQEGDLLVYNVIANRFLRGMVRGLAGTMLKVATSKISLEDFNKIIEEKNSASADFSVPGHALFLIGVKYPDTISS